MDDTVSGASDVPLPERTARVESQPSRFLGAVSLTESMWDEKALRAYGDARAAEADERAAQRTREQVEELLRATAKTHTVAADNRGPHDGDGFKAVALRAAADAIARGEHRTPGGAG